MTTSKTLLTKQEIKSINHKRSEMNIDLYYANLMIDNAIYTFNQLCIIAPNEYRIERFDNQRKYSCYHSFTENNDYYFNEKQILPKVIITHIPTNSIIRPYYKSQFVNEYIIDFETKPVLKAKTIHSHIKKLLK